MSILRASAHVAADRDQLLASLQDPVRLFGVRSGAAAVIPYPKGMLQDDAHVVVQRVRGRLVPLTVWPLDEPLAYRFGIGGRLTCELSEGVLTLTLDSADFALGSDARGDWQDSLVLWVQAIAQAAQGELPWTGTNIELPRQKLPAGQRATRPVRTARDLPAVPEEVWAAIPSPVPDGTACMDVDGTGGRWHVHLAQAGIALWDMRREEPTRLERTTLLGGEHGLRIAHRLKRRRNGTRLVLTASPGVVSWDRERRQTVRRELEQAITDIEDRLT